MSQSELMLSEVCRLSIYRFIDIHAIENKDEVANILVKGCTDRKKYYTWWIRRNDVNPKSMLQNIESTNLSEPEVIPDELINWALK